MMATTTRISMSVKPRARPPPMRECLVADVPVTDVGIDSLATGSAVGSVGKEVVLLAVGARVDVLVVIAPGVLADALQVATGLPVLDRRIGRLGDERGEALIGSRVLGVLQGEH